MRNPFGFTRNRVNEILEVAKPGDRFSRDCDIALMVLIAISVAAVVLDTIPSMAERYGDILLAVEVFSVGVFTIEYLLRIWSCTAKPRYAHPVWGRLKYMFTPLLLIDLLAILPFYMPLFGADLLFIRSVRLFRLFRVFKLGRYSDAFVLLVRVIQDKKEELLAATSMILFLLFISSGVMFYLERDAQPQTFTSILEALWWGVSTLTSVGYGDILPVTAEGKIVGGIVQILGVGLFALPAGVFAAGFTEAMARKRKPSICPHCGKEVLWK